MANRALTGLLLVGGASSRFGSPKALARVHGRTLAEIGREALAFCEDRIAIVKRHDRLDLPFPILDDGIDVRAPIAGLVAGLRAATHEICVALPVDTPRVTADALRGLAAACRDAAVPPTGPLPGAYRKTALPVLERRLADCSLALRDALGELDVAVVGLEPDQLLNVNAPDDLQRIG